MPNLKNSPDFRSLSVDQVRVLVKAAQNVPDLAAMWNELPPWAQYGLIGAGGGAVALPLLSLLFRDKEDRNLLQDLLIGLILGGGVGAGGWFLRGLLDKTNAPSPEDKPIADDKPQEDKAQQPSPPAPETPKSQTTAPPQPTPPQPTPPQPTPPQPTPKPQTTAPSQPTLGQSMQFLPAQADKIRSGPSPLEVGLSGTAGAAIGGAGGLGIGDLMARRALARGQVPTSVEPRTFQIRRGVRGARVGGLFGGALGLAAPYVTSWLAGRHEERPPAPAYFSLPNLPDNFNRTLQSSKQK